MKLRIDVQYNGKWRPGDALFHPQTPLDALDDVARDLHQILRRPVRVVKVYEWTEEIVETVSVFAEAVTEA